jgi:hypothetical protein
MAFNRFSVVEKIFNFGKLLNCFCNERIDELSSLLVFSNMEILGISFINGESVFKILELIRAIISEIRVNCCRKEDC